MTAPDGGFYSATDADSEGRTAVRRRRVLRLVGGGDRQHRAGPARTPSASSRYYGVTRGRQLRGREHPARRRVPTSASTRRWRAQRAALYAARAHRPPPFRDEKILAAWNGLAISALRRRRPHVRRAALRRRAARARRDFCSTRCARAAGWPAAAKDGRVGAPASSTTTRSWRGADRSVRGDVRAALAARRRSRSPARPSGCSPIRRAAGS